ncbi:MAG TPA: hypothetical protein VEU96_15780 [Bryobacteraceae bacterium]|nr:hypothetical protein [Bryobacteraceae bacterium]
MNELLPTIQIDFATGSQPTDVTADLIYVGKGDKDADYAGKDVAGDLPEGKPNDAISAGFGPVDAAKVIAFFRGIEKTGEFELKARVTASR